MYKDFGKIIITGEGEERCRALLVVQAIDDMQLGARLVTKTMAKQLGCKESTEYTKALKKAVGKECLEIRPTRTTLKNLTDSAQQVAARNACERVTSVPDQFRGPWPDGTISFSLENEAINGKDIWCNCRPASLTSSLTDQRN
uniref:Uncharacterized protein n=1 Tax=Candidatus Kentrum sp. FM TaxID=2126340 RepID=A0A450W4S7_9GAMM|nr:MAG: hypothetical protein BECKFM1743A_GA0114220_100232 [Candidatus Kentron sp. FM]VFJ58899.1 MAG: hypothetical protein BECKFM1743C_GA0114222_1023510 [Candidatus Kentron sp. FM]VFK12047.1 MAG: hypothetical protein BECKFM1743B_GA0114221_1022110 [Candidatus Kentron sp. FM]